MAGGPLYLPQYGPRRGPIYGPNTESTGGGSDPMAGVTRDGSSLIYVPSSLTELNTSFTAAGLPTVTSTDALIWPCQDGSGSLAEAVNGTVTLAPANTPTYSNAVTGWSRVAVGTVDATGNQRFSSTNAALPDLSATAALMIVYGAVLSTPAAVRGLYSLGTTQSEMRVTTTPALRTVSGANTGNGAANIGTVVRPWVHRVDLANTIDRVFSDQEKYDTVIGAVTGKQIQVGSTAAAAGPCRYLWAMLLMGAPSQLSDANIKTWLQTLGWTIAW